MIATSKEYVAAVVHTEILGICVFAVILLIWAAGKESQRNNPVEIKLRQFVFILAGLAFLVFVRKMTVFFIALNSMVSDYSTGDFNWIHQTVYAFFHQHPFQTSLYYFSGDGMVKNPFAYASEFAMHFNVTPYLINAIYMFFPDVNCLYATVIVFNVLGYCLFSWKLCAHLSSSAVTEKTLFVMSLLLISVFPSVIIYKCLFPLFIGPFLLALYYFILRNKRISTAITAILLVLISEDAALCTATFAIYLFFFEPGCKRSSIWLFLFAAGYAGAMAFILQPAAKYHFVVGCKIKAIAPAYPAANKNSQIEDRLQPGSKKKR